MFDSDVIIPITFFAFLAAIILVPSWLKSRDRRELQQTLRQAIERNLELPPEAIKALSAEGVKPQPTAARDMRVGVVLVAVSLGIVLLGVALSTIDNDAGFPIYGAAAIPGMIGLAFIVLSFFNPNKA